MAAIYRRKRGGKLSKSYYLTYYLHGRRVQKCLKTSDRKTADLLAKQVEIQIAQGTIDLIEKTALPEAIDDYLIRGRHEKAHATMATEQCRLRFVREFLTGRRGRRFVSEVTPGDLEALKSELFKGGRQPLTVVNWFRIIRAFFNDAKRLRYCRENPCDALAPIKGVEQKLPRFLSRGEARALLDVTEESPFHPFVALALFAGLRLGEMRWLRWKDVDLRRGTITVRKTKSHKPRTLPIPPDLGRILKALPRSSKHVCPNGQGGEYRNNLHREFKRFQKEAKVKDPVGFHVLRHTYASHLVMGGASLRAIAELLGHSDIKMTMVYAHLSPDHLAETVGKLSY